MKLKLTHINLQRMGLFLIVCSVCILGTILYFRDVNMLASLTNIRSTYSKSHLILYRLNSAFHRVGVQFFKHHGNFVQQKDEVYKELKQIKVILNEMQNNKMLVVFWTQLDLTHQITDLNNDYQRLFSAYHSYVKSFQHESKFDQVKLKTFEDAMFGAINKATTSVRELENAENVNIANKLTEIVKSSYLILYLIFAIIVLVILMTFLTSYFISRKLKRMSLLVQYIQKGNFDVPAGDEGTDDLGQLSLSLDEMRIALKHNIMQLRDEIKKRKETEEQIAYLAYHDKVTGLPNRAYFEELIEREITKAKRFERLLGLLYIDLDNFKNVNDSYGHDFGDMLLKKVGERIKSVIRSEDIATRISGDEFIVLLTEIQRPEDASWAGQKIVHALSETFHLDKVDVSVTCSVGSSIYPLTSANPTEMIKHADIAMYRAKQSGRNTCQSYVKKLGDAYQERLEVANRLPLAIKNKEFFLVYQPIVDIQSNKPVGMEALLRWKMPDKGLVLPAKFIPIAETSGIFNELGFWIIREAFKQFNVWSRNFDLTKNYLSVNLSAIQLEAEKIKGRVMEIADEFQLEPKNIGFEITESTIMLYSERAKDVLLDLHRHGFRVLIDDFGTGYSSFSRLKELNVTTLKVDKMFVDDIGKDKTGEKIIKSIISLAKTLELETIAEGVESQEQVEFLKGEGCRYVQGYYYGKPMKPVDVIKYLGENVAKKSQKD